MANLYSGKYLHLFFEDYADKGSGDSLTLEMYQEKNKVKDKIKRRAKKNLREGIKRTQGDFQEIENLYNFDADGSEKLPSQEKLKKINIAMSSFDDAISRLKQLVGSQASVDEASKIRNEIVLSIDEILEMGANVGGLADAAIAQIKAGKERLLALDLEYVTSVVSKEDKKAVSKKIIDIESNVSGYAFEVAMPYGLLGASNAGHSKMINIGGYNLSREGTVRIDPNLSRDLERIQSALQQNNGKQSKGDNIYMFNMSNTGNGEVSVTTNYHVLQNKNVRDISRIKIATYTYEQLNIQKYYNKNFLINVAGGLAGDRYRIAKKAGIDPEERTHQNNLMTQTQVDNIWLNIKNSMKILGVVDAMAGFAEENMTNQVDVYVIRSKNSGNIRVIPVQDFFSQLLAGLDEGNIESFGFPKGVNVIGGNDHRERYWTINYQNYVPLTGGITKPEAALQRSKAAYNPLWQEILKTKVTISVNFSNWF